MLLKLKRTPGLYLVGFMGSGKSAVGRLLADELGWSFADIDEDIEQAHGISIAEIFDTRGEQEFRGMEQEALRKQEEKEAAQRAQDLLTRKLEEARKADEEAHLLGRLAEAACEVALEIGHS